MCVCVCVVCVCACACMCVCVLCMKIEQHCRRNTDSLQLTGWDLYNYPRELDRQKVVWIECLYCVFVNAYVCMFVYVL